MTKRYPAPKGGKKTGASAKGGPRRSSEGRSTKSRSSESRSSESRSSESRSSERRGVRGERSEKAGRPSEKRELRSGSRRPSGERQRPAGGKAPRGGSSRPEGAKRSFGERTARGPRESGSRDDGTRERGPREGGARERFDSGKPARHQNFRKGPRPQGGGGARDRAGAREREGGHNQGSGRPVRQGGGPRRQQQQGQRDLCYGRRPVYELLRVRPSQIKQIYIADGAHFEPALTSALEGFPSLMRVRSDELDRLSEWGNHQGVVAVLRPPVFFTEEEVIKRSIGRNGLVCVLDQINDPHNFGAILRVCEAAGIDGVFFPERRNAPVSAVVRKTSAGASELLPISLMKNMQRTITQLKKAGFWIVGAQVGKGAKGLWQMEFPQRVALIMGSEGDGLRQLTERECDELVEIPMFGTLDSLNVSQAASVLLYEVRRQRSKKGAR